MEIPIKNRGKQYDMLGVERGKRIIAISIQIF